MRVYEAMAAAFAAEGCGPVFSLIGDGNIFLCGALGRDPQITLVAARHEAGAVAMADGFFRGTGRVGVASITHGPGLSQCATSLIAAARHRSSIVVVTGEAAVGAKNRIQAL